MAIFNRFLYVYQRVMQHKHQHIPIHQVMKVFRWQHQPDEAKWLPPVISTSPNNWDVSKWGTQKIHRRMGHFSPENNIGFGEPQFSDMPKCVGWTNNNPKTIGCTHMYMYIIYIYINRCYCQKQMDPICQQQIHNQNRFPVKAIKLPSPGNQKNQRRIPTRWGDHWGRVGTNSSAKASDLSLALTSTWDVSIIFPSFNGSFQWIGFLVKILTGNPWVFTIKLIKGFPVKIFPSSNSMFFEISIFYLLQGHSIHIYNYIYIFFFVGTLKSVQVCDFGNTDWWIMWMCIYIYVNHICKYKRAMGD